MRGGSEKVLDEIAFLLLGGALARLHADHALAAAPLRAKRAHGRALNKAAVRDADDATLIDDEVFDVDLRFVRNNFRQARRTVFVADFAQFFFDDGEDALLFGKNVEQIIDGLDELLVFVDDFLALESGQLIQTQVQDFVRLLFAECIAAIGEARRIANEDAELFDLAFRKFECEQFHSRFVAIS